MASSARTARHSRIASATFDSASASVCPWLTQPGIAGYLVSRGRLIHVVDYEDIDRAFLPLQLESQLFLDGLGKG